MASTRAEALLGVILLNSNEKGKGGSNYLQRVAATAGMGQTPIWGSLERRVDEEEGMWERNRKGGDGMIC